MLENCARTNNLEAMVEAATLRKRREYRHELAYSFVHIYNKRFEVEGRRDTVCKIVFVFIGITIGCILLAKFSTVQTKSLN